MATAGLIEDQTTVVGLVLHQYIADEGRAEAMAAQQAQEAEAVAAEPAADESASPAAEDAAPAENADPEKAVER